MPSELKIPRAESDHVKNIISDVNLTLDEKADRIYRFDEYILRKKRSFGVTVRQPMYSRYQIKDALIEMGR